MTDDQSKKEMLKLPKGEHLAFSLLTGAYILFACGLMFLMQGQGVIPINGDKTLNQMVTFVASLAVFMLGGYFLHSYNKWVAKNL
jgi:hypothetical protein